MTAPPWERVEPIVQQALDRPAEERRAFAVRSCGDDGPLLELVLSLLDADERAGDFLERPAAEVEPTPLQGPSTIGPYDVIRCLGSGGMGDVYLGLRDDEEFTREVAIKVLAPGLHGTALMERFRGERQILASLEHPNIARMYEGGTLEDGRPYLVMEYVAGEPLDAYCETHDLSLERCVDLFIEVCGAVDYAHRSLVLHLDLKPQNILVTEDGTPKLLDFGISKLLDPSVSARMHDTRTGQRPLTPRYASPEQHHQRALTTASDVYSLGVVLYRILSGRLPYGSSRALAALVDIVSGRPPPPPSEGPADTSEETTHRDGVAARYASFRPRLRGDLDAIVLKAIREEPERRYPSVAPLVEDLNRYREDVPVQARRGTFRYRMGKLLRRRRSSVLAGSIAVLTLLSFSVAMGVQASRLERQRTQAERQRAWAERQRHRAEVTSAFLVELITDTGAVRPQDVRLMTVGEVLDYGRSLLEHEYDSPEVDDALRVTLARMLVTVGEVDAAEAMLRRALGSTTARSGADDLDTATIWQALGWIATRQEGCGAALPLFERALDIRERNLPPGHDQITDSRMAVASVVHCERGYDEAAALYRAAIEPPQRRAVTVRDRLHVLMLQRERGITRWSLGDRAGGIEEFERIVEEFDAQGLPPYPRQAELLRDLGKGYRLSDQPERGLAALHRAREIIQAAHGGAHPREAPILIGLARQHRAMGDDEAFEAALLEALELTEPTLGCGHPVTRRAASWLRDLYVEQGREEERAQLDARVPLRPHEPTDPNTP